MKNFLLALALAGAPAAAFAQARIIFVNDAASPVELNPPASGVTLVAGLYGGTNSNSLLLQTVVIVTSEGNIPATSTALGGIPPIASGTPINANTPWFQVKVWDSEYPSYEAALATGQAYVGTGALFQMNPSAGLTLVRTAPPSINSTWHEGPIVASIPVPPPVLENLQLTNGLAQFDLQGTPGLTYRVEYALSLPATSWLVLTNITLPQSPFTILDPTAPTSDQRFYRAVQTP